MEVKIKDLNSVEEANGSDVFVSNNITNPEHKSLILTDYLGTHEEGSDFDDEGNIIKDGNIIKPYSEVVEHLSNFIASYDKTKFEGTPAAESNNDSGDNNDEVTVIDFIRHALDAEDVEVEGTFEASAEGAMQFINAVKPAIKDKLKNEIIEDLVAGDDKLIDIIKYYRTNNTIDGFIEKEYSYAQLDIEKMDDGMKKATVAEYLRLQKLDKNFIELTVKGLTGGEVLNAAASDAIKNLKSYEVTREENKKQERLRAIKEAEEFKANNLKIVNDALSSGVIKGFSIPKQKVDEFRDYLFKPVKDGKTQEMLDIENELSSMDDKLLAAYRRFSKYNDAALLTNTANSNKFKDLKELKFKTTTTPSNNKNNNFDKLGNVKIGNINFKTN